MKLMKEGSINKMAADGDSDGERIQLINEVDTLKIKLQGLLDLQWNLSMYITYTCTCMYIHTYIHVHINVYMYVLKCSLLK